MINVVVTVFVVQVLEFVRFSCKARFLIAVPTMCKFAKFLKIRIFVL